MTPLDVLTDGILLLLGGSVNAKQRAAVRKVLLQSQAAVRTDAVARERASLVKVLNQKVRLYCGSNEAELRRGLTMARRTVEDRT